MAVLCSSEVPVFVVRLRYRNAQRSGRDEYDPDEQVFHDEAPYVFTLDVGHGSHHIFRESHWMSLSIHGSK